MNGDNYLAEANVFSAAAKLTEVALPAGLIQSIAGSNQLIDANGSATPALKGIILLIWETWKTFADAMDISFASGAVHPIGAGGTVPPVPSPVQPPPTQPVTPTPAANPAAGILGNLSSLMAGS